MMGGRSEDGGGAMPEIHLLVEIHLVKVSQECSPRVPDLCLIEIIEFRHCYCLSVSSLLCPNCYIVKLS
jgi:hypothetical protein